MKTINNIIEGLFDAEDSLDKFAKEFDPELKWIKNNEIKQQVMQWCQPGRTTISCADAVYFFKSTKLTPEDLPKLIQALDILETMPSYITAGAKNLIGVKNEIEDAMRAVEFVNKHADVIKGTEEFVKKFNYKDITFQISFHGKRGSFILLIIGDENTKDVLENMKKYQKKIAGDKEVKFYESEIGAQMYIAI